MRGVGGVGGRCFKVDSYKKQAHSVNGTLRGGGGVGGGWGVPAAVWG